MSGRHYILCVLLLIAVTAAVFAARLMMAPEPREAPLRTALEGSTQIVDAEELPANISPSLRLFLAKKVEEKTTRIEKCTCDDADGMVARSKIALKLYGPISRASIPKVLSEGKALFHGTQLATYRMVYEGYDCDFRLIASRPADNLSLDAIEYVDCRRSDGLSDPGKHYNFAPLKGKVDTAAWRVDMSFADAAGKARYEVAGIDKDGYIQSVVYVKQGGDTCTILFSPESVVVDTICLTNIER
jgi:hypothetical protein